MFRLAKDLPKIKTRARLNIAPWATYGEPLNRNENNVAVFEIANVRRWRVFAIRSSVEHASEKLKTHTDKKYKETVRMP